MINFLNSLKSAQMAKRLILFGGIGLLLMAAPRIYAEATSASAVDSAAATKSVTDAVNIMWMLVAGFLVFFMQAGFALVETGFTRTKNVAHTMMMNIMVFCIGAVGYWLVGFAFQFGSVNAAYPAVTTAGAIAGEWAHSPTTLGDWAGLLAQPLIRFGQWGFLGGNGFMLIGVGGSTGLLAFFLFQMVFMDTAATIPTGSTAERLRFVGFCLMGLWVSMFIYPLVGGWVWGGGWLQNLGRIAGLGNGAVDFAGSGVVHMIGGSVALAGALVNGIWGLLAVGIFAAGNPATAGWNGVESPVSGLITGKGSQLLAQLCEIGAILAFVFGLSYLFFRLLNALGLLRSKVKDEIMGLDIPEMGVQGYSTVDLRMPGRRFSPQAPVEDRSALNRRSNN